MSVTEAYRLVGRLKNNRLWSAICDQWPEVRTQKDAADRLGVDQSYLGDVLNMKLWPFGPRGWSSKATKISEALALPVDYLFDGALYGKAPPMVELQFTPATQRLAAAAVPLQLAEGQARDRSARIDLALETLTPREEKVLRALFGLDGGGEQTQAEVARFFRCGRERIRQIQAKALRKLRWHGRADILRPVYDDVGDERPQFG